jgi:alpha-glucosidase
MRGIALGLAALIGALAPAAAAAAPAEPLLLTSPGGGVALRVSIGPEGRPSYALAYKGREVLAPSVLGLAFERYRQLSPGMAIARSERRAGIDDYPLIGRKSRVRDAYRELTVAFAETGGERRRLEIVFRAYDDGLAFRYRIPPQPALRQLRLEGEATEFAFPADYRCQAFNVGRFGSSHEGEFDPVQAARFRAHNLFDLPVVCETGAGGPAMAFAEADLKDYAGLYLAGRDSGDLGLQAKLARRPDDSAIAVAAWIGDQAFVSPWRLVMLADSVGKLAESTLVTSLAAPAERDYGWVKPGKYAWDWWNGPTLAAVSPAGMNDATLRAYIDFAGENRLDYMLIDDGWYANSGAGAAVLPGADNLSWVAAIDLPGLVRHAEARRVGLWLWVHWKLLDANMEQALPLYARLGIKGIKVDFMDRDDQAMVGFYHRLLRTAAANRLMVDLHGAFPPRGLARTYPNFLTQEGVFGAEYNKWTKRVTATHNVNLALTRNLLGPMDYTPGGFRNRTPAAFVPEVQTPTVQTTRGQALAMYVVYDSPFQGVSDSPDNYRGASGFDFVREVPVAWDETRSISAALGEHVAVARRRGDDWYVGAMTNEAGRAVAVPLAFLAPGRWRAEIWQDGAAPTEVAKTVREVGPGDRLTLKLAPSGGAVAKLSPMK